jgi:hypothetical protein
MVDLPAIKSPQHKISPAQKNRPTGYGLAAFLFTAK